MYLSRRKAFRRADDSSLDSNLGTKSEDLDSNLGTKSEDFDSNLGSSVPRSNVLRKKKRGELRFP